MPRTLRYLLTRMLDLDASDAFVSPDHTYLRIAGLLTPLPPLSPRQYKHLLTSFPEGLSSLSLYSHSFTLLRLDGKVLLRHA